MSFDRPNYAIPGLMPESSPVKDSILMANPDGSFDYLLHETPEEQPLHVVEWSLRPAGSCKVIRDKCNTLVFTQVSSGNTRYILRLPAGTISHGTSRIEILAGDILNTHWVTRARSYLRPHNEFLHTILNTNHGYTTLLIDDENYLSESGSALLCPI